MDISLELIITTVFLLATNIISIRWLRSDLVTQKKTHDEYVATHLVSSTETREKVNNLFKRTSDIMKREQVETIIKKELLPLKQQISTAVQNMESIGSNVANIDKSLAILSDRWERNGDSKL